MKDLIIKVAHNLENNLTTEDQAIFQLRSLLKIDNISEVSKLLKAVSKETWVAAKGTDLGWKEWYNEQNKLYLICEWLIADSYAGWRVDSIFDFEDSFVVTVTKPGIVHRLTLTCENDEVILASTDVWEL